MQIIDLLCRAHLSDAEKIQLIDQLLTSGQATLDERDNMMLTSHFGVEVSVLHAACLNSGVAVIVWLLNKKPELIHEKTSMGTNVLCYAAKFKNKAVAEYFLTRPDKDILVNAINDDKNTCLWFAVFGGDVEIFIMLKEALGYLGFYEPAKQARIETKDNILNHMLCLAAQNNTEPGMVVALIGLGADPHQWINPLGNYYPAYCEKGYFPIHHAAKGKCPAIITYLVEEEGVDINQLQDAQAQGITIAQSQTRIPRTPKSILFHLASQGIDVTHLNSDAIDADIPAHAAARRYGTLDVLKEIIRLGGNLNKFDGQGNAVIHLAVLGHDLSILNYLLAIQKISVNFPNYWKDTPLHIACNYGKHWFDIIIMLNKFGASNVLRNCINKLPWELVTNDADIIAVVSNPAVMGLKELQAVQRNQLDLLNTDSNIFHSKIIVRQLTVYNNNPASFLKFIKSALRIDADTFCEEQGIENKLLRLAIIQREIMEKKSCDYLELIFLERSLKDLLFFARVNKNPSFKQLKVEEDKPHLFTDLTNPILSFLAPDNLIPFLTLYGLIKEGVNSTTANLQQEQSTGTFNALARIRFFERVNNEIKSEITGNTAHDLKKRRISNHH